MAEPSLLAFGAGVPEELVFGPWVDSGVEVEGVLVSEELLVAELLDVAELVALGLKLGIFPEVPVMENVPEKAVYEPAVYFMK